jgi:hypothetical protein
MVYLSYQIPFHNFAAERLRKKQFTLARTIAYRPANAWNGALIDLKPARSS